MKKIKTALIISILALCASCSVPITCILYNNSGHEIEITKHKSKVLLEPVVVKPGSAAEFNEWESGAYLIKTQNKAYSFRLDVYKQPNAEYVSYQGIISKKRILKAQLEPDMKIYALKTSQGFPSASIQDQPDGYPLILYSE